MADCLLQVYQDDHYDGVLHLYRRIFGDKNADDFAKRWRWSQCNNLAPDNTPRWVLSDEGTVVGYLGTIPQYYRVDQTTLLAHTPCDYMVDSKYQFHGIKLMREFFRTCNHCVTADDIPATVKVTQWLGAKPVGELLRFVKLLDGRSLASRARFSVWPRWMFWPITCMLRVLDKIIPVRSGCFSSHEVKRVRSFDANFEKFYQRLSQNATVMVVRDARFLNWRYGPQSPHAHSHIGAVFDKAGDIQGYIVFCASQSAEATGYILDLQVSPDAAPDIALALLRYAIRQLRRDGAWSVRYHHFAGPTNVPHFALELLGFSRRAAKHQLLIRFKKEADANLEKGLRFEHWNYVYGDAEASHAAM